MVASCSCILVMNESFSIKAIIGLGNPGRAHAHERHNIGFRVLDELAATYGGTWSKRQNSESAEIVINNHTILLIKPQTYMNTSGDVIPSLTKKGIKAENILVVHDELEKPFGNISIKKGGSAKGHNGLRSIIQYCGPEFVRLRFGIGRPEHKQEVGTYVLSPFSQPASDLENAIAQSLTVIAQLFA